jgi:hypothetical protein
MNTRFAPHDRFTRGLILFAAAGLAILILALASGCSSLPSFARPVVPVVGTNEVVSQVLSPVERVEWRTNTVMVTNILAGERIVVTNVQAVAPVIVFTNEVRLVTNQVIVTNGFAVNPDFSSAVETARRANSAMNPTPTAPMVDWGLTLFGLAASGVAAWKTRQQKKTQGVLTTAIDVRDTLIKAVETAPPAVSDALKRHVASIANLRDIGPELNAAVQKVTAAMADGHMTAEEFVDLANDPSVTEDMIPEAMRAAFRKFRA